MILDAAVLLDHMPETAVRRFSDVVQAARVNLPRRLPRMIYTARPGSIGLLLIARCQSMLFLDGATSHENMGY